MNMVQGGLEQFESYSKRTERKRIKHNWSQICQQIGGSIVRFKTKSFYIIHSVELIKKKLTKDANANQFKFLCVCFFFSLQTAIQIIYLACEMHKTTKEKVHFMRR